MEELGLDVPIDDRILSATDGSPLAEPLAMGPLHAGNRWCIHPMEGWDAHRDGSPSPHTLRRWHNFGASGAKLIWGGEAAAVVPAGRANPNQTLATPDNRAGLAALLDALRRAHQASFGTLDGLCVGLQLTHSGRFCRPNGPRLEPRLAYHHPLLDAKFHIDPADASLVLSDDEVERLIDAYVAAAGLRGTLASISSTSSPATATCCTSFSVPGGGRAASAATSPGARGCCERLSVELGSFIPAFRSACG